MMQVLGKLTIGPLAVAVQRNITHACLIVVGHNHMRGQLSHTEGESLAGVRVWYHCTTCAEWGVDSRLVARRASWIRMLRGELQYKRRNTNVSISGAVHCMHED